MKDFNVNKILKENLLKTIEDKGYANLLLFDTETTGIEKPIYITQIGYILLKITIQNNILEFEEILEKEIDYYAPKRIEPMAVYVTSIIREVDLADKVYMEAINKIYKEKNAKSKIKKIFEQEDANVLTEELGYFKVEDIDIIKSEDGSTYEIDFSSGHNLFEYDYKSVLTATYNLETKSDTVFDTLYYNMNATKTNGDRLSKTKQGRNLNNTVSDIISKIKDTEYLGEIEKLMAERELAHSALLDIKVNLIATKYQMQKIIDIDYPVIDNSNNNTRTYGKEDILYLETNMSKNNIITINEIIDFSKENEIKKVIIVDKYWSNNVAYFDNLKKHGITMYMGLKVLNLDDKLEYDLIMTNTSDYRHIMAIVNDFSTINNEKLKDIRDETNCLVIPSSKMPIPKYYSSEDRDIFYSITSALDNDVMTLQEKEIFVKEKYEDLSLLSGFFTSDVKQKWLQDQLVEKEFEEIDFFFYEKLELSAFPPLTVLSDFVKVEPVDITGYIDALMSLINELFYDGKGKNTLEKVLKTTSFTTKNYEDRIEEEITVLKSTGNSDYIKYFFLMYKNRLIVEDELNKGEEDNTLKIDAYGPGRGSAAGSLIAFILGITDTNPLKYDLLFERFINPERVSMPDIDVDIQDKDLYYNILSKYYNTVMPNIMDYSKPPFDVYSSNMIEKYIKPKEDFVGKISAISYTTKKTILANIVRLYALPYFVQTTVSREFIEDKEVTLYDNVMNSSVRSEISQILQEKELEKLDKYGVKGNKLFANYGLHAAGVLFYPYHAAVMTPSLGGNVTIWDGNYIEEMFLVKMDYLGLATKAAIDEIRKKMFQAGHGDSIFKNNDQELDDPITLKAMYEGKTSMTFQMESASARRILNKLAPLVFDDIVAANALNRPGPLGSGAVDDYISASIEEKRKKYGFKYYSRDEIKEKTKEEIKVLQDKIRFNMSQKYIIKSDGSKISNLLKGNNHSLEDTDGNIYYINELELVKLNVKGEEERMGIPKEFHMGFDLVLLADNVIMNLLTAEPYFSSTKFTQKIHDIYSNLEYMDDETELYILNKEHECKTLEDFNSALSNSPEFYNYLKLEEFDYDYEKVLEELSFKDKEIKKAIYDEISSNQDRDVLKYLISDFGNLDKAKTIGMEQYIKEYFDKVKDIHTNLEYSGGLPIYKRINLMLKTSTEDAFRSKILELEMNIKNHPIYSFLTYETYKTIVYQEQIMKISMNMAGYTKGESDNLRKAIAKQKKDMMNLHKKKLIEGLTSYTGDLRYLNDYMHLIVRDNKDGTFVVTNTRDNKKTILKGHILEDGNIIYTEENEELISKFSNTIGALNKNKAPLLTNIEARYLWEKIEKFGEYAFNKSHSASYSILSYETQYYKEHFPLIAYSVLLKYVPEKHKQSLLTEIKEAKIKIDLQKVDGDISIDYIYSQDKNAILLPISHVKSLGSKDLFPIIPLVKTYDTSNIEEFIILMGSIPKKVLETFGVLGMFTDKTGNSVISQVEWYYSMEYDEEMKKENKKHIPVIVKQILEKAFKATDFQKLYKAFYKDYKVENQDHFMLLKDIKFLTDLYMFDNIKKSFNVDEKESGGEKYMEEYQKLYINISKKINTLKVTEEFKDYLKEKIDNEEYTFFEDLEMYDSFIKFRIAKTKELSLFLKEKILEKKKENLLEDIIKKGLEGEKSYKYDLEKEYLTLPDDMQQILYEAKLKEGNPFIATPNYKNSKLIPYIELDNFTDREDKSNDTKQFRQMMNISESINKSKGTYINVVIITDYMPKCNKEHLYATVGAHGKMTMKEHFENVFNAIPEEEREYINPVWISLFDKIKDEVEIEDEETGISLLNNQEYVDKRIVEVFEKIIKSGVYHIILAMPQRSVLREKIVMQQYKTFQNKNGTKYIKYRTSDGIIINNKLVSFTDGIFPYTFIEDMYINRAQQLLSVTGNEVDFLEYMKEQRKNSKKN